MNKPIAVGAIIAIIVVYIFAIDGSCESDDSAAAQGESQPVATVGNSGSSSSNSQSSSSSDVPSSSSSNSPSVDSPRGRIFDGEQLYKEVLPSVATLVVDHGDGTGGTGTGFLAYEDGIIVTAWHVVDGAQSVFAKFADGEVVACTGLIAKDVEQDIAIVKIKNSSRRLLPINIDRPAIGSKAFIVGAPKGREFSFSDGTVSQNESMEVELDGIPRRRETIQFNCSTSPGNSGGPLFDSNGVVRGIVSFQYREGQNLNFAIPMSLSSKLDRTAEVIPWALVR
jgi:S1-C subfamily serine protease